MHSPRSRSVLGRVSLIMALLMASLPPVHAMEICHPPIVCLVTFTAASSDNPQEASSTAATGEPGTDSGGDAVTAALGEGTGSEGGEGEDGGKKKKRKKR